MTPAEYLAFFAPELAGVSEDDRAKALLIAETYRPKVPDVEKQAQGVALYAAHLLTLRRQYAADGGPIAPLKVEQSGDTRYEYAIPASVLDGTGGTPYYDRWTFLAARPVLGVTLTGAKLFPR